MKVVTKDQMEYIDKTTSEVYGFPSIILMENAGIQITKKIIELYPDIINQSKFVTILIGPGNNGGDGLVIARHLFNYGIEPFVVILADEEKFKGDALTNLNIAKNLEMYISITPDDSTYDYQKKKILNSDYIIDAIFGTGLKGKPRDFPSYVINEINEKFKNIIISIDIPSGMTSTINNKSDTMIKATETICVNLPKINMVDYPGKEYIGNLSIVDIGFPSNLLKDKKIKTNLIYKDEAALLLNNRTNYGHKGTFGNVLVIAGSKEFTGASALTSISALKIGAGLVTLASHPKACDTVRNMYPEIICVPLIDDDTDGVSHKIYEENLNILKKFIDKAECIVTGPGISSYSTFKLIKEILSIYRGKVVIDAGVLNFYSKEIDSLKKLTASVVITPHIKEFSRLAKVEIENINNNKIEILRKFCAEYNLYVVLKSAVTVIGDMNENIYFNTTGNNGLGSGGTGDVLAGMIGGLCAQGYSIPQASILSVYLHGLSADLLLEKETTHTITATTLIEYFSRALKEVI